MKSQRKANIDDFRRRPQYERLEGHLFLDFSADDGNEDVPIQDYFGFIHAFHLPPVVFMKFMFVADKLIFKTSYIVHLN